MRNLAILIHLCISLCCFSQKPEQRNALVTVRANVGIPKTVSSKMFRTSFSGLYEANLSVNLRLFSNVYLGVGYQNTHFQNNKEVFVFYRAKNGTLSYNTRLLGHGAFVKLGYDKFFSEKGYFSYALNTGLMMNNYLNVNADTSRYNYPPSPENFNSIYLQPEISANFIVERRLSFSLMLSYTTTFRHFDPKGPRFNQFEEIRTTRNKYLMTWLCFGVGFNVLLNGK
ncbi:MAG: hypothetical protein V4635_07630 [Bacteroidota bacterium]